MVEQKANVTRSGARYQDELPVGDITIGRRFRKSLGDLRSLEASIRDVGLLHPVVVDDNKNLIAGLRRLEACKRLGWTKVPVRRVNLTDMFKGEFHENAVRKDFTVSEIVAIKRALEPTVREEAKKRQGRRTDLGKEPSAESARSRDVISEYVGISHDTLAKAERLVEAAEKNPARFGPTLERVDSGQTSLNYALSMIRRAETGSSESVQQEGAGGPHRASTAEIADDVMVPMRRTMEAAIRVQKRFKKLKPQIEKEMREKPELSVPLVKASQAMLGKVPVLQCPHCGANPTEVVWKCCQGGFKTEG